MSLKPFDLIHYDIWGPFQTIAVEGFRYFLTIVDDCSRYTWVYLLQNKSDVKQVVPRFFTMISTQFGTQIKVVRSDNAKELNFDEFFASICVVHYHYYLNRNHFIVDS